VTPTTPPAFGWADLRRGENDPRPPGPLVVTIAFGLLLGWVALGSAFGLHRPVMVAGVVVIATVTSWWLTVPAALVVGAMAFLFLNGFVENALGQLTWNGMDDALLLLALLALPAMSAELGFEVLSDRQRRRESIEVAQSGGQGMDG
jgi:predicted Abi (CAAX) family protease